MYGKITCGGIYLIQHNSGYYYLGMSVNVFERWNSHYSQIRILKHSSPKFMKLWNATKPNEWTFRILHHLSKTDFKSITGFKGKELDSKYRKELLMLEKSYMKLYSKTYALNKNDSYFK
jgi:predicted GIY-YIG superfamily endonuclease